MEFQIVAKVDQLVTKEILLAVEAEDEKEAVDKATSALGEYPKKVTVEGVNRMVTTNVDYWIPKSIDFVSVKKANPIG